MFVYPSAKARATCLEIYFTIDKRMFIAGMM